MMINRVEILRNYVERLLYETSDGFELRFCYMSHMMAVSQFCALIALKRGEDAELATMAGLLHDYYAYKTFDAKGHAKKGAVLAREVLDDLGITTAEETEKICSAIRNHSKKAGTHSSFDEILVDADVMQHSLFNITLPVIGKEQERFANLVKEFSLNAK